MTQTRTIVCIALAAVLLGPAAPAASAIGSEIFGWFVVADTPEGIVTELVPASDVTVACGGTAPVVSSCVNTGVRTTFLMSHGFAFPVLDPTGKVVFVGHGLSSLAGSDGRTRNFDCDFVRVDTQAPAAPLNACRGSGSFPGIGSSLTQTVTMSGHSGAGPAAAGEWRGQLTT